MPDTVVRVSYKVPKRRKNAPTKRVKLKPVSRLKKELEALQKALVVKLYGTDCYTCDAKNLSGANCQLGHVPWPRSIISTKAKFRVILTRIQCFNCNIRRGGMGAKALARMQKEGIDTEALWEQSASEKGKIVPRAWFEEQISLYTQKLSTLEQNLLESKEKEVD